MQIRLYSGEKGTLKMSYPIISFGSSTVDNSTKWITTYLFCSWSLLAILSGSEAIVFTMLSDVCWSILGMSTPLLPSTVSWHISHIMSFSLCCVKNSSRRETHLLNPIPGLQKKCNHSQMMSNWVLFNGNFWEILLHLPKQSHVFEKLSKIGIVN